MKQTWWLLFGHFTHNVSWYSVGSVCSSHWQPRTLGFSHRILNDIPTGWTCLSDWPPRTLYKGQLMYSGWHLLKWTVSIIPTSHVRLKRSKLPFWLYQKNKIIFCPDTITKKLKTSTFLFSLCRQNLLYSDLLIFWLHSWYSAFQCRSLYIFSLFVPFILLVLLSPCNIFRFLFIPQCKVM